MLRFLTAGESHGRGLVVVVDGVPAGLHVDVTAITRELRRRQGGYGRGKRMAIECDTPVIVAGIRHGISTGAPIAITIDNRDWVHWQYTMHTGPNPTDDTPGARRSSVTRPRPGHADLAGALKYGHRDLRDVIERSSARETAARVAAGAIARQLLGQVAIRLASYVVSIGDVRAPDAAEPTFDQIAAIPDDSATRSVDAGLHARMIAAIDAAREQGDTLGGVFEVVATGVPPGLGSYAQWDRRLDGRLAQAIMSIPAIKAVGIGIGPDAAGRPGSLAHDAIVRAADPAADLPFARPTNRAGGVEGGVTNGQDVRVTAYMKPISTLMKPLRSVDLVTLDEVEAAIERSDVCAVPAASVVGEAMVALTLADAVLDRFGGDTIGDLQRNHAAVAKRLQARFGPTAGESGP